MARNSEQKSTREIRFRAIRRLRRGRRVLTTAIVVGITIAAGLLGTAGPAHAVQFPPQLSKSFAASTIQVGQTTTLTFDVYNPEPNDPIVNVNFTDNLPTGLVVATPPNTTLPDPACGGALSASAGSGTVSLSGGSVPAGGYLCVFSVDVTGTTAGPKHNVTSQLTADTTNPNDTIDPGSPATADIQVAPACTQTISGTVNSVYTGPGTTCINNARVNGSIYVNSGTTAIIQNSSIGGSINASNPTGLTVCGSQVASALNVSGSTGFVLIGDPTDDACAGNTIGGSVTLSRNTAGVEVAQNTRIGGTLTLSSNSGSGPFLPDDTSPEVEGNAISGNLTCYGNGAVKNDGQSNHVSGSRTGQCAGL
jgi:uncharacterized repeat protein (TIGR01451 family)